MPRSRTVKGGFFRSPDIQHTPVGCRLLFISLWTQADREGRLEDLPWKIRDEAFPYDVDITEQHVDEWLEILDRRDLITRYVIDGQPLIFITKWRTHQHPHPKEAESKLPEPPANPRQTRTQIIGAGDIITGNGSVHTRVRTDRARTSDTSKPSSTSGSSSTSANRRHSGGGSSSRAGAHEDAPLAAASIATNLRAWERDRGKMARGITASHPHVIELADLHVSVEELRRAYDAAVADREATSDLTPINAGFVRVFVDKLRNPPKKREDNGWRRTPAGIEGKASELGIACPPGRDHAWLAEKCEAVMRQRAQANEVA